MYVHTIRSVRDGSYRFFIAKRNFLKDLDEFDRWTSSNLKSYNFIQLHFYQIESLITAASLLTLCLSFGLLLLLLLPLISRLFRRRLAVGLPAAIHVMAFGTHFARLLPLGGSSVELARGKMSVEYDGVATTVAGTVAQTILRRHVEELGGGSRVGEGPLGRDAEAVREGCRHFC
jgi:hypothetical protein